MGPAVMLFETGVLNGVLIADSPLLTWAVSNAHVLTDPAGNRKISKEYAASGRRVDPLISTIMALGLAGKDARTAGTVLRRARDLIVKEDLHEPKN